MPPEPDITAVTSHPVIVSAAAPRGAGEHGIGGSAMPEGAEVRHEVGGAGGRLRRCADVLGSLLIGLLVLVPAAVVALAVLVAMGRPVLFRQTRVGRNGAEFTIYKFRTMRSTDRPVDSDADDAVRTTRVGALLRTTSLDELPQLWNILRGDMGFVGPRPTLPRQVRHYTARQRGRLAVRPGITGWAQINGRNSLSWPHRIELDLWYIEHRSWRLDLAILVRTVGRVLRPAGVTGEGGHNPDFPVPAGEPGATDPVDVDTDPGLDTEGPGVLPAPRRPPADAPSHPTDHVA